MERFFEIIYTRQQLRQGKEFSLLYEGKLILRFNYQFREYNQSYDTSFLDDIILDYELIFHNDSIIWYRYRLNFNNVTQPQIYTRRYENRDRCWTDGSFSTWTSSSCVTVSSDSPVNFIPVTSTYAHMPRHRSFIFPASLTHVPRVVQMRFSLYN